MQRKGFLLLAIICGLIAAGSTYIYLNNAKSSPLVTLKPLVVAKIDIPARTVIQPDQVMLKDVPSQGYPQGGASNIQSVIGSVTLVNLKAGDSLVSNVLQQPADQAATPSIPNSSALAVPEGKRAVAIPIGLVSGVGYNVRPGDHVDILVTMDIKDASGNNPQTLTSLAAQDILVLSVGENAAKDKNAGDSKSFTLALTVPQAMAVTLGSEKGSLRLLLRNPANTEIRQETPFNSNQFMDPNYSNRYK
jgi:pilus assembly protein CpaB